MSEIWHKFLVWFGLSENDHLDHADPHEEQQEHREDRSQRQNVRRLQRAEPGRPIVQAVPSPLSKLTVIEPRNFNDSPKIADRLKASEPVIMNLQNLSPELSQRLMDFVSGSTYCLGGRVQQVGDKVILITPSNVEVSDEEKRRLQEKGFFFANNQGKSSESAAARSRKRIQERRLLSSSDG